MSITKSLAPAVMIAASFAAWALFTSPSRAAGEAVIIPEFSADAQAGMVAYEKNCAACRGVNTVGSDKGPPFLHAFYKPGHHGDISFSNAAKLGVRAHHWRFGDMSAVEGITDEDIAIIIRYVREIQVANGF